ncbi:nucleoporin-related [Forsythia ovata]|uniref:Nucleoporin-related n=1 Tax=Forsythia ovata TaxID=205694 RepID=A0ABD1SJR4_9LAMI
MEKGNIRRVAECLMAVKIDRMPELTANAEDSVKGSSSSLLFRYAERGGPSEVADGLKRVSECNEFGQVKEKNSSDGIDFSRFEQLLKGKTFSREEINHLLEILNSRADVEGEKKKLGGGDAEQIMLTQEIPRIPVEEKQQDSDRPIIGTSIQKPDKDVDRLIIGTSLQKADVSDSIGASPVDIAQAYMGSRTSERGHDPYSLMSKSKRAQPLNDEFVTKPFMPPPSPKPSICWPGAEVHEGRGYVTPQNQRGRYGHLDFPRTPYSRTIASKSRIKLQTDSRFQNRSSTPFQQSQTSIYGQEKIGGDAVDSYGSVGPIRRIRNKFASEVRPRGSIFHELI